MGVFTVVSGPIGSPRASYAGSAVTGEQYMFVRNAVLGGMSGAEIQRALAGTDLALRRQAIFDIRREVLGIQRGGRVIENTPTRFYPSEAAFQPTAMPLGGAYRVTGSINVPTPIAGDVNTIYATITFNRPLTRGELDAGIMSVLQPFAEAYGFADENGNLAFSSSDIDYIAAEREL